MTTTETKTKTNDNEQQNPVDPHAVTISGYVVDPLYGPPSAENRDYETEINEPGKYPYARGVHPGM